MFCLFLFLTVFQILPCRFSQTRSFKEPFHTYSVSDSVLPWARAASGSLESQWGQACLDAKGLMLSVTYKVKKIPFWRVVGLFKKHSEFSCKSRSFYLSSNFKTSTKAQVSHQACIWVWSVPHTSRGAAWPSHYAKELPVRVLELEVSWSNWSCTSWLLDGPWEKPF